MIREVRTCRLQPGTGTEFVRAATVRPVSVLCRGRHRGTPQWFSQPVRSTDAAS